MATRRTSSKAPPPRKASDDVPPRFFTHTLRPQWGRAIIETLLDDRIRYVFEDGSHRTFRHDNDAIVEVEVPEDERDDLAKKLNRLAK